MGGRWHHPIMISVMIVIIISNDRILIASIIVNVDIIIIESMKNRLYFSFLFLNFCLARTRLGSASTIGTIGIVTSWPGDSHKQTNKNICHLCNYRKQYKYNSHKYTNVNDITKQIPIIVKDMTDARFKQYKKTSVANFTNISSRFICERPGASMVEAWSNLNWYFTISRILLDFSEIDYKAEIYQCFNTYLFSLFL